MLEDQHQKKNICRVLVLGDQGVGKTCLINRFVTGHYDQPSCRETEEDKLISTVRRRTRFLISESSSAQVDSDQFDAVVLCFSLSSSVSLARVLSSWSGVTRALVTVLAGLKSDLKPGTGNTSTRDAQTVARQIGATTYIETSAKLSYSSTAAVFEAAAFSSLPPLSRQSSVMSTSSMISSPSRKFIKNKPRERDQSDPRPHHLPPPHSSSAAMKPPPALNRSRRQLSSSSSNIFSKQGSVSSSKTSSLSSTKSSSSVISISTNKTPLLTRKAQKRDKSVDKMIKIKVERLNKERQMEEVEIEIPASVYNNMQQVERDQRDQDSVRSEFVRNCGKRNSLANKLKQLMIR